MFLMRTCSVNEIYQKIPRGRFCFRQKTITTKIYRNTVYILWKLCILSNLVKNQKQPFRGVFRKGCSDNTQQICRITPMPKCNFNKVALQLYWNHFSTSVFSWKLLHIFTVLRIPHRKVASGKERNEKRLKEQIRRQTEFTLV